VDLCGKKVLDMGTATGYIAFAAEELGAREVTALDIPSLADEDGVPFLGN
jgi:ribosomal protein L11 methylase PrmA